MPKEKKLIAHEHLSAIMKGVVYKEYKTPEALLALIKSPGGKEALNKQLGELNAVLSEALSQQNQDTTSEQLNASLHEVLGSDVVEVMGTAEITHIGKEIATYLQSESQPLTRKTSVIELTETQLSKLSRQHPELSIKRTGKKLQITLPHKIEDEASLCKVLSLLLGTESTVPNAADLMERLQEVGTVMCEGVGLDLVVTFAPRPSSQLAKECMKQPSPGSMMFFHDGDTIVKGRSTQGLVVKGNGATPRKVEEIAERYGKSPITQSLPPMTFLHDGKVIANESHQGTFIDTGSSSDIRTPVLPTATPMLKTVASELITITEESEDFYRVKMSYAKMNKKQAQSLQAILMGPLGIDNACYLDDTVTRKFRTGYITSLAFDEKDAANALVETLNDSLDVGTKNQSSSTLTLKPALS